jgi:hypothetical protein
MLDMRIILEGFEIEDTIKLIAAFFGRGIGLRADQPERLRGPSTAEKKRQDTLERVHRFRAAKRRERKMAVIKERTKRK